VELSSVRTFFNEKRWKPLGFKLCRVAGFYLVTVLIVAGFLVMNWKFFVPANLDKSLIPLLALGWWVQAWLSIFLIEIFWPILILIFFKVEKERNPKRIIAIGQRFRKYQMNTPQIWILQESIPFWTNRIFGFSMLPSPFGSVLLIEKEIAESWDSEELLTFFSRWSCEYKFLRWSSWGYISFTTAPALALLALSWANKSLGADILIPAALILTVAVSMAQEWYRQRLIDLRTIRDFSYDPEAYAICLEKWKRPFRFEQAPSSYSKESSEWVLPKFLDLASTTTVGTIFVTVISVALGGPKASEYANIAENKKPNVRHKLPELPKPVVVTAPLVAQPVAPLPVNVLSLAVTTGDFRGILKNLYQLPIHTQDAAVHGATPLLLAVGKGDAEFAYFLIKLGADMKTEVDDNGEGALFYGLKAPNSEYMVKYLLALGADVHQKNLEGLTALEIAKKNKQQAQLKLLQKSLGDDRQPAAALGSEKKDPVDEKVLSNKKSLKKNSTKLSKGTKKAKKAVKTSRLKKKKKESRNE
jgi:hypothetical protein